MTSDVVSPMIRFGGCKETNLQSLGISTFVFFSKLCLFEVSLSKLLQKVILHFSLRVFSQIQVVAC